MRSLVSVLLLGCSLALSTATHLDASPREVRPWDTDWRFSKTDSAMSMAPTFDDSTWEVVRVPHDWSQHEPFSPAYGSGNGFAAGGIAWYRKHFTAEESMAGRHVSVEFDGIYDHSEVWLNGHYLGGRPYGYSSFHLDLTRYLIPGKNNVLAVRVDHSRYADSRWYTGSGIYRHVRLTITDPLHVAPWGTFVSTPEVTDDSARIQIETTVANTGAEPRDTALQFAVIDPSGQVVAETRVNTRVTPGQTTIDAPALVVPNPQRWSLDTPQLYTLRTRVVAGDNVLDETITSFGIRTFAFNAATGFTLNGKSLKLQGVCLHHDGGSVGAAVPTAVLERRLRQLKAIGVNAIRCSHNPPAPELLDLCDRLGLLVQNEALDEFTPTKRKWVQGWNVGEPGRHGYGADFAEWAERDVADMVRRDRNHPSVIMWSIGNEIDYPNDPFSHPVLGDRYRPANPPASDLPILAAPLAAAIRKLDTTRPVTMAIASAEMAQAVGLTDLLDVVGYNYQELRYAEDHAAHPDRVLYGSENRHDYTAWLAVRDNPYISAQFLWTGFDYLGEAHGWPERGADFGLFDLAGFKKPRGWFRESLWSPEPMVYIAAALDANSTRDIAANQGTPALDRLRRAATQESWNWPEGSTLTITGYSNCDSVELTLNDRPIGTLTAADAVEGTLTWTVPYEPGTLRATGLRDGRVVASFTLQTAGPADRVVLRAVETPAPAVVLPGEPAVAHVIYEVVDANGIRLADATHNVSFAIEGPARLLGIGNGNLRDTTSTLNAEHRAYQGRGLALLARTGEGSVRLQATAPGLKPATLGLLPEK